MGLTVKTMRLVVAVLAIADGTDGKDDAHSGVALLQQRDTLLQSFAALLHRQLFFLEQPLRTLLAVIDNLAGLLQPIDVVGA